MSQPEITVPPHAPLALPCPQFAMGCCCLRCRAAQAQRYGQPLPLSPAKTRTMAIVWALFLGGVGAHKFYQNEPGWGVLYALFCWTFIPTALAAIELVYLLCISDERFARDLAGA